VVTLLIVAAVPSRHYLRDETLDEIKPVISEVQALGAITQGMDRPD
jgi:hypothetical protein